MSTAVRVSREVAYPVALRLVDSLRDVTSRIEIAGSLRREKPDVGDIELVAVPLVDEVADGMFGTTTVNRLSERRDSLIATRDLASHPTDPKRGERYSKLIEPRSGLQVDLFSASAESFGLILLIRTGSADYSHRFVIDLRRRSLHVGDGQLHRGGLGCGSYTCEVVPTPEEVDVYAAAGWPFVRPEYRA